MTDIRTSNLALVLTSSQMAAADAYTIKELKVSGETLMERAGESLLRETLSRRPNLKKITVLCGKGNNGGDGLVIARRASEKGIEVSVVIFANQSEIKGDAKLALDKCLKSSAKFFTVSQINQALESPDCIIDALYGINFRGSLSDAEKNAAQITANLRESKKVFVVAVDLPSGSICDTGAVIGECFNCDLTVTFQAFKPLHFCFPAAKFCGERVVADIGIEASSFATAKLITPQLFDEPLLVASSGHKGVRGHLAVIAGSPGHSGAAALTSRAGLRAGAGLVTVFSDPETCKIAVEVTPEVMSSGTNEAELELISSIKKGAAVIGPGLDLDSSIFTKALKLSINLPKVIDATALRILAKENVAELLKNAVLTPHPGELAALLNCSTKEILDDRFGSVRKAASQYRCAVILKGAYTLIAFENGQVLVSPFANSNLGTAGSGDVLSGLIGGLLSRGLSIETAATVGVYLHGQIGSTLLPDGVVGSLASEFADSFPEAFGDLITNKKEFSWEVIPALV